ncbi:MAG: OmpW family outer membrane protein [Pseudomonadota bacterium]
MKTSTLTIALAGLGLLCGQAMAQESPWLIRVRAVHIKPANESAPLAGVGASDRIHVSSKTIPDFNISYFFTLNLAAELVLTYPQKHTVTLDGAAIGTFKHLPPTLSAQYHFAPAATIKPYVGLGLNYTRISSVRLLGGAADLENSSVGLSLQLGADFQLNKNWSLNLDLKKVRIGSDVLVAGARASHVSIDPLLFGVGAGYRF